MNPIINPWLFYLAEVVTGIEFICILYTIIGGIAILFMGICIIADDGWDELDADYDNQYKRMFKWIKRLVVLLIIAIVLIILLPDKQTIYQMIVFQNITVDNVNLGIDKVKEFIDYTVEKIGELKGE